MIGKTIYLITKTVGEYEDRFTEIIKAKTTKESAEKFVSDQIEKYDSISEINESWNNWVKGLWKLIDPEKIQKRQKASKWIIAGAALLGGSLGLLKTKGNGFWGTMKQIGITILGTGAGLFGGAFIASKCTTPPGAAEFSKATQALSKLDIQPV